MRIPRLAPLPMPTVKAVGVARPSEHGQAITRTVTIAISPLVKPSAGSRRTQHNRVTMETQIITGTKTAATLSARTSNDPFWLMVPANTLSPLDLRLGTGSPVSIDSSTYDSPSSTTPSAGILSPGLTVNMSPGLSDTDLGWRPINSRMDAVVPRLAFSSNTLPTRMKATIIADDSK